MNQKKLKHFVILFYKLINFNIGFLEFPKIKGVIILLHNASTPTEHYFVKTFYKI